MNRPSGNQQCPCAQRESEGAHARFSVLSHQDIPVFFLFIFLFNIMQVTFDIYIYIVG